MVCQKDLANAVNPSGLLASIARALAHAMFAIVCSSVAIRISWSVVLGIDLDPAEFLEIGTT